jgi:DNA-binding CsgD family transcriptional regulator
LIDIPTILASALLVLTTGVALKYYRVLQSARKEYEEARETVEDIVLSFNKQLQHETERLEAATFKVETLSSKVDRVSKSAGENHETLRAAELKLASALQDKEIESLRLEEMTKRINELVTSQSTFATRISKLDEQAKQFLAISEPNVQAAIPIRRDRALAPLTETELSVLEMLSSEGEKTAPEIKDRVKLSREHTARLMKKLYEGGYLERNTGKIPFKYSVKKEMGEILRRTEGESA